MPARSEGKLVSASARGPSGKGPSGETDRAVKPGADLVPARIGPYRVLELFARRTFYVTYRARHEELGRTVLVKTLKPTVSVSSPFSQALDREARILAGMRHESVVSLFDFVRTPETMWMVLEDVRGHALSEVIARAGRLGVDTATAVGLEIARGLGHAHDRGVVHRDLRPENVMLTPEGGVKIMEFAAAEGGRMPTSPEPFEGESAFARPDYMAPEQILGEASGARADVFSLGVILYEMLSGARPFEDAAEKDRRDSAPRVSRGSPAPLGVIAPSVPRDLERVVMRCLARDPDDRFESARVVAAALEEALAERTRLPLRVLVSRALAAAKLGEEIPAGGAPAAGERVPVVANSPLGPALRGFLVIFSLIVAGGLAVELGVRDDDRVEATPLAEGPSLSAPSEGRGYLRVLAKPWAEILIDGELVDTTPIGRPIVVSVGRHYVTFRHPNAPDEKRSIQVGSGQTVVLDVSMRIDRAIAADAGTDAAGSAAASP